MNDVTFRMHKVRTLSWKRKLEQKVSLDVNIDGKLITFVVSNLQKLKETTEVETVINSCDFKLTCLGGKPLYGQIYVEKLKGHVIQVSF